MRQLELLHFLSEASKEEFFASFAETYFKLYAYLEMRGLRLEILPFSEDNHFVDEADLDELYELFYE